MISYIDAFKFQLVVISFRRFRRFVHGLCFLNSIQVFTAGMFLPFNQVKTTILHTLIVLKARRSMISKEFMFEFAKCKAPCFTYFTSLNDNILLCMDNVSI